MIRLFGSQAGDPECPLQHQSQAVVSGNYFPRLLVLASLNFSWN